MQNVWYIHAWMLNYGSYSHIIFGNPYYEKYFIDISMRTMNFPIYFSVDSLSR